MPSPSQPRKPYRAELGQAVAPVRPAPEPVRDAPVPADNSELVAFLTRELGAIREELAALRDGAGPAPATAGATAADEESFRQDVRLEIAQMVKSIARTKQELAAIRHPLSENDQINSASSELDEIIAATERATNSILDANEDIERQLATISAQASDANEEGIVTAADHIAARLTDIYEASNFQDITGQRITKVIKTLRFLEDRILAMINVFGVEAFADLPVEAGDQDDPDAALLNGPQASNQGITQAEIDALFD